MAPITLEHAALAIAGIGVALNAYVVLRINQLRTRVRVIPLKPGEALQASALLPLDLREDLSLASRRSAAPGESATVDVAEDVGMSSNTDDRPRLKPVRELGSLQEVCNHCGARLGTPAGMEGHFVDGHRQVAGVDHLDSASPHVGAGHVKRHESHLQSDRVLADQPHGVEHAERSAQHRNP